MSFILAPTLIKHGSAEQRARFLPPLLRADELWCQGFSEPEAGSDLPSLRTRAVRDGDAYVVTGQKVWTSQAELSDWMFALVRTGSQASRNDGISFLLIKMDSPGITVRPLRDITGGAKFSEVFLDEVRVPVTQRVGQENQGWKIARTSLGHERTTMSMSSDYRYRRIVDELFDLARQTGQIDDPLTRQRLAHSLIGARVLTANAARTLGAVLSGGDPGPEASANRVFRAEFEQHLHETALALLGRSAVLDGSDPAAVQGGRWTYGYLATRASTIGAGTSEIQRNTIAEKVLGLPAT
jgi:alkylation response protein AidB-like acyl-CoA dehydrogenase